MADLDVTIWLRDGDTISVRERTMKPGCAVAVAGAVLYMEPGVEAELLALLMARAPKLALRPVAPVDDDLAIPRPEDFPLGFDVGFVGSPHGDPPAAQAEVVAFPDRGANFRTVGSFSGGDAA